MQVSRVIDEKSLKEIYAANLAKNRKVYRTYAKIHTFLKMFNFCKFSSGKFLETSNTETPSHVL